MSEVIKEFTVNVKLEMKIIKYSESSYALDLTFGNGEPIIGFTGDSESEVMTCIEDFFSNRETVYTATEI